MVFGGRATTVMPAMPQALEEQTEGIVSALSGSEWFEDEGSIHANSAPAAGSITPLLHTPVDLLSDAFILVWQSGVQGSNIDAGHAANSDYVGRWIAQPLVPGMDVTAPWPQPREGASMSAWALDGSSEPGGDNSDNIVVMFGGVVQPQDGVADGLRAGTSGAGWTNWGRLEPDNKDGKEGQCVTMLSQGAVAGQRLLVEDLQLASVQFQVNCYQTL
eukprot:XP_001695653.1 predicted protein [Chlamydomonas reinhardtii]